MEHKFYINWQVLIEEAKQRRKKQKLTQQQLAALAKVSTPTVSSFENGEKNLHLSSILNILGELGMVDYRRLDFPQAEAKYIPDREVIRFIGKDGDKKIICEISKEVLGDYFSNGHETDPIKIFRENQQAIEHEARRKYMNEKIDAEGMVFIGHADL